MCMHPLPEGSCEQHACTPIPKMWRPKGTHRAPPKEMCKRASRCGGRKDGTPGCNGLIYWARVQNKKGLIRPHPLNGDKTYYLKAGHRGGGSILAVAFLPASEDDPALVGKWVRGNEVDEGDHDYIAWASHFSTCPMADGFR